MTNSTKALASLMTQWLAIVNSLPEGSDSSPESDKLVLACILLAKEDSANIDSEILPKVEECLSRALESRYASIDRIPWFIIRAYIRDGTLSQGLDEDITEFLGHHNSSIRAWFHYVAGLIIDDLSVGETRNVLLGNMADKLGAVDSSVGLLALMHPNLTELDTIADEFQAPDGFEQQYQNRLKRTRDLGWQALTPEYLIRENECRRLIWTSPMAITEPDLPSLTPISSSYEPELCINIWWFTIEGSDIVTYCAARAYMIGGDDKYKGQILGQLAEFDYLNVEWKPLPKRFITVSPYGDSIRGMIGLAHARHDESFIEEIIASLELTLPKKNYIFTGDLDEPTVYAIGQNPYRFETVVVQTKSGHISALARPNQN